MKSIDFVTNFTQSAGAVEYSDLDMTLNNLMVRFH